MKNHQNLKLNLRNNYNRSFKIELIRLFNSAINNRLIFYFYEILLQTVLPFLKKDNFLSQIIVRS